MHAWERPMQEGNDLGFGYPLEPPPPQKGHPLNVPARMQTQPHAAQPRKTKMSAVKRNEEYSRANITTTCRSRARPL
jgi:hypothetical protein